MEADWELIRSWVYGTWHKRWVEGTLTHPGGSIEWDVGFPSGLRKRRLYKYRTRRSRQRSTFVFLSGQTTHPMKRFDPMHYSGHTMFPE